MKRRWFLAAGLLSLTAALTLALTRPAPSPSQAPPAPSLPAPQRIVSLAPAITETLEALGAKDSLIALSDYCTTEAPLPRVGTAITPHYENIALQRPDAIWTTQVSGSQLAPLARLAPVQEFPWLTPTDLVSSLRQMGQLLHKQDQAELLARRFEEVFSQKPPSDAPRVLLLLSYESAGGGTYWFIQDNSLHGALLRAAGARNAWSHPVPGAPRLSVEQLLQTQPDALILLTVSAQEPTGKDSLRDELLKLTPLRAVQEGRIGHLGGAHIFDTGPSLLEWVEPLRQTIQALLTSP